MINFEEVKQAIAICEKYNISIYRGGDNPLSGEEEVSVRMYDSDTFFAMSSDYYRFSGSAYCVNNDGGYFCYDNCDDCQHRAFYQPYVKRAEGVRFYCAVPQNDEFEEKQRKLIR